MENTVTEKKRALAHIERIAWVKPIAGADSIELVGVLGWQCIAKKGEFAEGDMCVYIEIDSKVPAREEFKFLEQRKYKIKTLKFAKFKDDGGRPVFSQGIALPLCMFRNVKEVSRGSEGDDVTDALGVTYYDPEDRARKAWKPVSKYDAMMQRNKSVFSKPWVKRMMRKGWFRKVMFVLYGRKKDKPFQMPSWIRKTDEDRIELFPQYLLDHKTVWLKTEKIDGTSGTFAIDRRPFSGWEYIVCSRNVRMRTRTQKCYFDDNVYWEISDMYRIDEVLPKLAKSIGKAEGFRIRRLILQGEIYGYKLQGNPYKMNNRDFKAFNLIVEGKKFLGGVFRVKYNTYDMDNYLGQFGIPCVPILGTYVFPEGITMPEFKEDADGASVVNPDVMREGVVYRNVLDAGQSFKSVSNEYDFRKTKNK